MDFSIDGMDATIFNQKKGKQKVCLLAVHGGGWVAGNHKSLEDTCSVLANELDIPALTISYTLAGIDPLIASKLLFAQMAVFLFLSLLSHSHISIAFILACILLTTVILITIVEAHYGKREAHPAQVNDVSKAISYCLDNVADKIILFGHSAGAHLCTLVATSDLYCDRREDIACVVAISGVYSHTHFKTITGAIPFVLYKSVFKNASPKEIFPILNVDENSPSHLVISAESDFGLRRHAHDYVALLIDNGVYAKWKTYERTNHLNIRRYFDEEHKHIADDILDFCREHIARYL